MQITVLSTSERPDLVPLVARWLWEGFKQGADPSYEPTLDAVRRSVTAKIMPRTFILLADGEAVGTASLVAHDLVERPDLTPWLAGVFVEPKARGRGLVAHLIAAVENAARQNAVSALWLFTRTAEQVYVRAGWRTVDVVEHMEEPYVLMRRDLD